MTELNLVERVEDSDGHGLEVLGASGLLTAEQALLLQAVKSNLVDPFIAITNRELDIRQEESKQELGLAREELAREHEHRKYSLFISGGLMFFIVAIGGGLLFVDKEAGLFLFSLVGVGAGTYSFGKSQRKA